MTIITFEHPQAESIEVPLPPTETTGGGVIIRSEVYIVKFSTFERDTSRIYHAINLKNNGALLLYSCRLQGHQF